MTTLGRQIGLFAERRRTEAELMQVNARLNALLDASTQVSIIAADPDGLITVFNPGAERMLGYSAQEMVGVSTPLLIHDAQEVSAHAARLSAEFGTTIEGFDTFVERARRGGHDVGEWTYIRKDGTRLTVLLAVTAVFDPEGNINGFLGIATDLTDRQRAERNLRESEARFRRLVEANILGVVFGDIKGNITDANDAFLEMVGYTREQMDAGRLPWDALIPSTSVEHLQRCRAEPKRRGRAPCSSWNVGERMARVFPCCSASLCSTSVDPPSPAHQLWRSALTSRSGNAWKTSFADTPASWPRPTPARTSFWRCWDTSCAIPWLQFAMPSRS